MGRQLKVIFTWLVIGFILGMWFGINTGRGRPFYANPFAERTMQDKLKSTVGEGVEKMGKSVKELGENLKGKQQ